ncbi:pro-FMRFamide-related neuropeptide VF, partial [Corythoichthys intestinalis]|uniref:pro-FMRFamide-related neuropeptide VF n=1 Tax=Corythoichthys intestinalis TaxID=161448 RepID=UPI0025A5D5E0
MMKKILLSVLVMMGGLDVATLSDPKVRGKLIHCGKDAQTCDRGWHIGRKQTQHQTKIEMHRSLDLDNFKIHAIPTTSKISFPSMVKLQLPSTLSPHRMANMPLRFGRDGDNAPNKPQRFG